MKKSLPINKSSIHAKLKAMLLHFLLSVFVLIIALYWIIKILYPSFHFELNGGIHVLKLLIGIDLILGPLITLLVFHPLKPLKEKISDFVIVGVIQITALAYGLHTLYQEHPKMLAYYNHGRMEVIKQGIWDFNQTPLDKFPLIEKVPVAFFRVSGGQYIPLTPELMLEGDKSVRKSLGFAEKIHLNNLESEYGKLYLSIIAGKYKTAYIALDGKLNIVSVFGYKDLL